MLSWDILKCQNKIAQSMTVHNLAIEQTKIAKFETQIIEDKYSTAIISKLSSQIEQWTTYISKIL